MNVCMFSYSAFPTAFFSAPHLSHYLVSAHQPMRFFTFSIVRAREHTTMLRSTTRAGLRMQTMATRHLQTVSDTYRVDNKVRIGYGVGGRSSEAGLTVTVFGASGFLGRYITSKLATGFDGIGGAHVVVPFRDDYKKRFLKVTGDLGKIVNVEIDLRNVQSLRDAIQYSDVIVNTIGTDYNTKNFSMADTNIAIAERISDLCQEHSKRLIHVSLYNANPESDLVFYATKGVGEAIVKQNPLATIVRPAPMYGREDNLLNYLGPKLKMWTPNRNAKIVRPVDVMDVAEAVCKLVYKDAAVGETYELYGPQQLLFREIREIIHGITQNYAHVGPLNYLFADYQFPLLPLKLVAAAKHFLYWRTTNPDQVQRHLIDQVVDPSAKTFADLDIAPIEISEKIFSLTKQWRHPLLAQLGAPQSVKKEALRLRQQEHFGA